MAFLIDTAVVPAGERLDYWADASGPVYHPVCMRAGQGVPFHARMAGHDLGPIAAYRIVASEATMRQTTRTIRCFDPECLMFIVDVRGRSRISQDERCAIVGPGDIAAYTTSRPLTVQATTPFETLVFRIPRYLLGVHGQRIGGLVALRVPGERPLARLVTAFCRQLMDGLDAGELPENESHLGESVLDLMMGLYGGRDNSRGMAVRGSKTGLFSGPNGSLTKTSETRRSARN